MSEEFHPIQTDIDHRGRRGGAVMPSVVTLRAYEVYRELHGDQEALITNGCRGGFGVGELIAFLYARSFPKPEWCARFNEAIRRPQS